MLKQLWNDDAGYIVSTEMLLIFVILVLGLIAGLANVRMALVMELTESGLAILNLSQGYTIAGLTGCSGSTAPSGATDTSGTLRLTSSTTAFSVDTIVCP